MISINVDIEDIGQGHDAQHSGSPPEVGAKLCIIVICFCLMLFDIFSYLMLFFFE